MLFKYWIGRWRQRRRRIPSFFTPEIAAPVEACRVSVDDAGLWMRRISQRLAEQAFCRSGIAQPREHKVDHGAGGVDGSAEKTPTALDTNVGLITRQDLWLGLR